MRIPGSQLSRREFLKLSAAAAGAAVLYPLRERAGLAAAREPSAVKVLIENLYLGAGELARGTLDGVTETDRGIALAPGRAAGRYTSPILNAETPFTHIGLHWTGANAVLIEPEVRWAAGAAAWSAWEPVMLEAHAPPDANGEVFGALVAAGRGTRVQFRTRLVADGTSLSSATVTLLNAVDGPTTMALDSSGEMPPITAGAVFQRSDWGADENLRLDSDGNEIWRRMYVPVKKVVVHHTATSNAYTTVEDAKAEVRAIYTYHAVTLGWGDIGYNSIIDKWGNVYEGRHGRGEGSSREPFSPGVVAGHASSHNYGSTGAGLLGTYTKAGEGGRPGITLSAGTYASLVDLVAWECGRHDVGPQAVSDFLLINDSWNRGLANIAGHRDCNATICPGGHVYDLLPSLRADVEAQVARSSPSINLVAPAEDTVDVNDVSGLEFSWASAEAGSFLYLLEAWRRQAPDSEDIDYLSGFDADAYPAWKGTNSSAASFGELFEAFSALPAPVAGRYTFHVLAADGERLGYRAEHTLLVTGEAGGDSTPRVSIAHPGNGGTVSGTVTVLVEATDEEDVQGGLAAEVSIDGGAWQAAPYNSDSGFYELDWDTTSLTDGTQHTIDARATDSNGNIGNAAQISVTVDNSLSDGISLSATGYKVRGLQKADLSWNGATSPNVDVYRDGVRIATTPNDGAYTDNIDQRGGGSYTYQLFEEGSTTGGSNEVTVSF